MGRELYMGIGLAVQCSPLSLPYHKALGMLNKELGLVKSLSATLSSFKEDPTIAARYSGHTEEPAPRDPDVWPPPTPVENRLETFDDRVPLLAASDIKEFLSIIMHCTFDLTKSIHV